MPGYQWPICVDCTPCIFRLSQRAAAIPKLRLFYHTFWNTSKSWGIQKPEFSEKLPEFFRSLFSKIKPKTPILGLFGPEFFGKWQKAEFFSTWVFLASVKKKAWIKPFSSIMQKFSVLQKFSVWQKFSVLQNFSAWRFLLEQKFSVPILWDRKFLFQILAPRKWVSGTSQDGCSLEIPKVPDPLDPWEHPDHGADPPLLPTPGWAP